MVNNLEAIKKLFYFNEANNMFFHCQIVKRAKDYKGESKKVREDSLHAYLVRSKEHLDQLMPEIILLCEHYGARAYINVAGKDFSKVRNEMATLLIADMTLEIARNPKKYLNSAAGLVQSRVAKWIIDIDNKDEVYKIKDYITNTLSGSDKMGGKTIQVYAHIPTKSGVHLITSAFNLQEFHNKFPHIDVHKNSMGTLLYSPKSIDKLDI